MLRSRKPRRKLLADFFQADGNNPNSKVNLRHFDSAFVQPPDLEKMISTIAPNNTSKRVILIDGHPRSGKTWLVLGALAEVVDRFDLTPDNWWTAGIDCRKVCPEGRVTLNTAVSRVVERLTELPNRENLRFVLLDDLLGTNIFRPVHDDDDVRTFFTWNEQNPCLKVIPEDCTLIITARSFFFMLLETFLDFKVRASENATPCELVRWGIFRSVDDGKLVGGWDRDQLRQVAIQNRRHHPFARHRDRDLILLSAPLIVFSDDQVVDADGKTHAAHVLFGEDMATLADEVVRLSEKHDRTPREAKALDTLQKALLMTTAPGVVFLGPSAYDSLGIDPELAKELHLSMYYSDERFRLGRVPNEFYMIAVNEHLAEYTPLALATLESVLRRVAESQQIAVEDLPGLGLALRGIIERSLSDAKPSVTELFRNTFIKELIEAYQAKHSDPLLHFELKKKACEVSETAPAGLAAAVSWAFYRFFSQSEDHALRDAVTGWYERQLKVLIASFPNDVNCHAVACTGACNAMTTFFSTFLQWAIKALGTENYLRRVTDVEQMSTSPGVSFVLKTILEDELLWALLEMIRDLSALPATAKLTESLSTLVSPQTLDVSEKEILVNRLFCLTWHNEWMDGYRELAKRQEGLPGKRSQQKHLSRSDWEQLVDIVKKWIQHYEAFVLKLIQEEPHLLDVNLQYHWCHFITQRATWMRDWCFQEDPDAFEREPSQIARGSTSRKHNHRLCEIALALIGNSYSGPQRMRNVFFFLITRRHRLPQKEFKQICERVDQLMQDDRTAEKYCAQAIFELARQGLIEADSDLSADDDDVCGTGFIRWCFDRLRHMEQQTNTIQEAWDAYFRELQKVTHHLDLLPREHVGWQDVIESYEELLPEIA